MDIIRICWWVVVFLQCEQCTMCTFCWWVGSTNLVRWWVENLFPLWTLHNVQCAHSVGALKSFAPVWTLHRAPCAHSVGGLVCWCFSPVWILHTVHSKHLLLVHPLHRLQPPPASIQDEFNLQREVDIDFWIDKGGENSGSTDKLKFGCLFWWSQQSILWLKKKTTFKFQASLYIDCRKKINRSNFMRLFEATVWRQTPRTSKSVKTRTTQIKGEVNWRMRLWELVARAGATQQWYSARRSPRPSGEYSSRPDGQKVGEATFADGYFGPSLNVDSTQSLQEHRI